GRSCDPECRGKLVDVMLSTYGEAQGDYDEALRKLVQLSRGEAGPAMAQLHARVLWCQVDGDDLLLPALVAALGKPGMDRTVLEDLIGLVALAPEPVAPAADDPDPAHVQEANASLVSWKSLIAALDKAGDRTSRLFNTRRAAVRRERTNPPPMIKRVSF